MAVGLTRPANVTATDDGWIRLALTVVNDSAELSLSCQFLLAHWFESTLGPIVPGDEAMQHLVVRPRTGDVAISNAVGDRMAVERLSCGPTGADRTRWTDPPVDRLRRGDGAITLGCRLDDAQADCRFDHGRASWKALQ